MSLFSWLPWVRHREQARDTPLSPQQLDVLRHNAPFTRMLDDAQNARLHRLIQLFMYDKTFEGCGGLEMTETIALTIAAHACLLLLGLDQDDPYPGLDVIRVYPSTYRAPDFDVVAGQLIEGGVTHRLGESSHRGYVVLSWDAVERGVRRQDGDNVVFHEFAHQLDAQDGVSDGAPPLERSLYGPWARILGDAYDQLHEDLEHHRRTLIDPYGATAPAEFFAVVTETFFERPRELRDQAPELYAVLGRYYGQDPARWRPVPR